VTREAQRRDEREDIQEFLRLSGLAVDSVEFADAPDAVLEMGTRRIGLEHTELEEEDLKANESNLFDFEAMLQRELQTLDVHLLVGVGLAGNERLFRRRRDVEALAKRLALWVRDNAPMAPLRPSTRWIAEQGFPELVMLSLEFRDEPRAIVSPSVLGPGNMSIEPAVRAKEKKLAAYRASVDEAWLLLVTGRSWTQMTDSVITDGLEVETAFDAVFLLDVREGRVQRLPRPRKTPART
jgi:hypothetical protein